MQTNIFNYYDFCEQLSVSILYGEVFFFFCFENFPLFHFILFSRLQKFTIIAESFIQLCFFSCNMIFNTIIYYLSFCSRNYESIIKALSASWFFSVVLWWCIFRMKEFNLLCSDSYFCASSIRFVSRLFYIH